MIFPPSLFAKMSLLHLDLKQHTHKFKFNAPVQRLSQIIQKPISLKSLGLSFWLDKFYVLCVTAELNDVSWEGSQALGSSVWISDWVSWFFLSLHTAIRGLDRAMLPNTSFLLWSGLYGSVPPLWLQESHTGLYCLNIFPATVEAKALPWNSLSWAVFICLKFHLCLI